jgi:membrane-associated phospholipid phosphatase
VAAVRQGSVARMAARMWWLPLIPVGFFTDRGSRSRWLLIPGIVTLTALASSVGKLVIRRARPGSAYRVAPWGYLSAAGFPSTHSACAFAIAGWLRTSRQGRWLHAVAVLIGWSRVRCRAHHFTDVAAGAILGYGIVWQIDKAWSRLRTGRVSRPQQIGFARPLRPSLAGGRADRRGPGAPPAALGVGNDVEEIVVAATAEPAWESEAGPPMGCCDRLE